MSADLRRAVQADIAEHIRIHGPKDWNLVKERYPALFGPATGEVGERKFKRWVAAVREGASTKEAIKTAKEMVGRQLPVAPPPAYITAYGADGIKRIDFLGAIAQLWEDVENLRFHTFQMEKDPDDATKMRLKHNAVNGKPAIADRINFDKTITRRIDILEHALKVMQEIWDLERVEKFYHEMISIIAEEIVPAEPVIARRVMERLKALNARRSMTVHLDPEDDPEAQGGPAPASF